VKVWVVEGGLAPSSLKTPPSLKWNLATKNADSAAGEDDDDG
jgi:hypothetical protein